LPVAKVTNTRRRAGPEPVRGRPGRPLDCAAAVPTVTCRYRSSGPDPGRAAVPMLSGEKFRGLHKASKEYA